MDRILGSIDLVVQVVTPQMSLKENEVFTFLFSLKVAPCNYYYVSLTIYFVHIIIVSLLFESCEVISGALGWKHLFREGG